MILLRLIGRDGILSERILGPDPLSFGALPEVALSEIHQFFASRDRILFLETEDFRITLERVDDRRALFVFGAGHVGRSVALMGAMLGLRVVLIDDRQEFLEQSELLGCGIKCLLVNFAELSNFVVLTGECACVIVTRGHQYDELILRQIAKRDVGYVGMIGSKRRVMGIFERLKQQGTDENFLSKVKAPIGLRIGAVSPQEIAVAIHAEIIQYFGSGLNGQA